MPDFSFTHYEFIDDGIIEITAHEGAELDISEAEECLSLYQKHQFVRIQYDGGRGARGVYICYLSGK